MDKYDIVINKEARDDINIIAEYVFKFTFDYYLSEKLVNEIYSIIYTLKIFPNRYKNYKNNIKTVLVRWKYKIFYKVDLENKIVTVYRIFSNLQNYENII